MDPKQNEADKAKEALAKSNDGKPAVEATKPAENVKVVAQAGTVPPSMQADGPSPPHPSSDKPDPTAASEEVRKAQARLAEAEADEDPKRIQPSNIGEPEGEPIQCIVKKRFFDERQATIREGSTYYYQRRKGMTFPYEILEPVSKSVASAVRKEYEEKRAWKDETLRQRQQRREAFARMAAETE
jgi:hypothetical protein